MDLSRYFHNMTPEKLEKMDPVIRMAMESFVHNMNREEDEREAIRRGEVEMIPTQSWNISDRH